jgi:hypothetical protein
VCARAGGANTTPLFFSNFSAAYFAKRNLNGGGFQSEGGQKFIPPNPLSFCPPERSESFVPRVARQSGVFSEIFDKMISSRVVKIHHNLTFCKFPDHFGGRAKRVPSISLRQILSARRAQARLAVGQEEVRLPRNFNSVSDLLCPKLLTNQNI